LRTILVVYLINNVIHLRLDARKLMFLIASTGHISKDDIGARDTLPLPATLELWESQTLSNVRELGA
jgi:hypothetical protein